MKMIKYDPVHEYLIDWLDNWLGRFKFDHRKGIVRAIINFVENQKVYDIDVERQTPKKPIIIKDGEAWMRIDCPKCKAGTRSLQNFCDCCGQAIDWSGFK